MRFAPGRSHGTAWQDACTQFHRIHPETLGQCEESDLRIHGELGLARLREKERGE
jgi:hypothetical protein